MKAFTKIQLGNGLRIIFVPQPGALAATVLVLVRTGSEYESKRLNGLSHFLEHMCFKGTVNRPRPGMIAAELDALGSEYNAFTAQEYTGYWAKSRARNLPRILDLVSDLYLNPVFNEAEIAKERGVVIEEINLDEDTPPRRVHDLFNTLLYGDQPAGWDIAGPKQNIRRLNRRDFIAYRRKHYVPASTVVVVSGDFDHQVTRKFIEERFGGLPRLPRVKKPKTTERQTRPAVSVKFKASDQSHLVLGVRAFDIFDRRRYALQVMQSVLGGGMSSRLFHRIREELGAAYYVRAHDALFLDHGNFSVSAGVDHRKFDVVVKAILEEFTKLTQTPVGAQELTKTKDHLIGTMVLGLETSDELAGFYGGQEVLTGKIVPLKEYMAKIKAVTASQIQKVARDIFKERTLNLAVIGPYKTSSPIKKILKLG